MGTVKIDITEGHRKYTNIYALNTAKGVERLLRDRHKIAARRFVGDYAACDIIIDLNDAIDRADLSRRQTEAITLLYGCGLTQADAATEMDVTRQAVTKFNAEACQKIARVFQDWNYGEVNVGYKFNYIELFSGIGGFRSALDGLGGKCVFASEIDRFARRSYQALYDDAPELCGDITQMYARFVPNHDLLVAGFPCQAFSMAGQRRGFDDTRGTLFFQIARIAKEKRPRMLLLENVKGLLSHDKGRTFEVMAQTLSDIGYALDFVVLNSKYFSVPQNRERVFIAAHHSITPEAWDISGNNTVSWTKRRMQALGIRTFNFDWPANDAVTMRLRDVLEPEVHKKYYMSEEKTTTLVERNVTIPRDDDDTLKVERIGSTVPSGRGVNGSVYADSGLSPTLTTNDGGGVRVLEKQRGYRIRRLTPRECWRLQGFTDEQFDKAKGAGLSDTQLYRQAGNAVTVNVISAISRRMIPMLFTNYENGRLKVVI